MIDNPYQPPNADPEDTAPNKHRSFRLTPSPESADDSVALSTLRDAISFTLIQQLPILLLSALLLDGGWVFKRVAVASVAFWIITLIILMRRGRNMPKSDLLLIKWGYLPMLLTSCVLWAVGLSIIF